MVSDEPRDPETPDQSGPAEDESDLARPVAPPSRMRGERGERHLTRRVIAPAALLLVSVPVVAVLFLNLRAVTDRTDSSPASAGTIPTASASPSPSDTPSDPSSAAPATSKSPSESPSEEPTATPTPTESADEPSVDRLSATSGPVGGNQVVTLRGDDLDPVTQVLFGPITASNLEHVSATVIRVTTPPGTPGKVRVVAKTGADDVTSAPLSYTYQ